MAEERDMGRELGCCAAIVFSSGNIMGTGGGGGTKGRKFLASSWMFIWMLWPGWPSKCVVFVASALEAEAWVIAARSSDSSGDVESV